MMGLYAAGVQDMAGSHVRGLDLPADSYLPRV